jgi:hypothetical protein
MLVPALIQSKCDLAVYVPNSYAKPLELSERYASDSTDPAPAIDTSGNKRLSASVAHCDLPFLGLCHPR